MALVLALAVQIPVLLFLREQTRGSGLSDYPPPESDFTARIVPVQRAKIVEKPEEPDVLDGQVVKVPEPEEEVEPPEETKHLSNANTKVEKETKARPSPATKHDRGGHARVEKPSAVQSPKSTSAEQTESKQEQKEMELPRPREKARPTELGEKPAFDELQRGRENSFLLPSTSSANALANLQALSGQFKSDDALLDVEEEADETMLDSRKFRYWDFFNRVKERVREHWRPQDVYRKRDPMGRVYGVKDRLTVLTVTLDDAGKLQRMTTVKDSGAEFLDEEARRAFQAAAPFPNPPVGLLDEYGQVTFQFGFLFEISSGRRHSFWKRL